MPTSKILDVGCGYGRILSTLYQNEFHNLIGIDPSFKMIERGKNEHPYLDLREYDKTKLPFENNSFDSVILSGVLTCIIDNQEQIALIEEIKRIMRKNGIIYVNDFLLNTDARNLERYNLFKNQYNFGAFELPEKVVLRHHAKEWIVDLFNCFETFEFKDITYTTMNGNKSNGFYFIGGKK